MFFLFISFLSLLIVCRFFSKWFPLSIVLFTPGRMIEELGNIPTEELPLFTVPFPFQFLQVYTLHCTIQPIHLSPCQSIKS